MKKKELLEKLIAHYESVIEEVKNQSSLKYVQDFIYNKETDLGICSSAKRLFGQNIYEKGWFKNKGKIAKYPESGKTIPEIVELLQVRVDAMKQELTIE